MRVHVGGDVMLDDRGGGAFAQFDQVTQMPSLVGGTGRADENEMDGCRGLDTGNDTKRDAFAGERRVESREDLVLAIEATYRPVAIVVRVRQCPQRDAIRASMGARMGWIEASVDEHNTR